MACLHFRHYLLAWKICLMMLTVSINVVIASQSPTLSPTKILVRTKILWTVLVRTITNPKYHSTIETSIDELLCAIRRIVECFESNQF